ncbi:hypothetical protein D3C78_777800 [compost metagenome]
MGHCARQNPLPQGNDESRLLRQRDEFGRGDQPFLRVPPTHQSLQPGHTSRQQIQLGLVVKFELLGLQRPLQIDQASGSLGKPVVHGAFVIAHRIVLRLHGQAQRRPRVLHEIHGRFAVFRIKAHAKTQLNMNGPVFDLQWLVLNVQSQSLHQAADLQRVCGLWPEQRKAALPESRQQHGAPQDGLQPQSNLLDDGDAERLSVSGLDTVVVLELQTNHRNAQRTLLGIGKHRLQGLFERMAVEQAGDCIE